MINLKDYECLVDYYRNFSDNLYIYKFECGCDKNVTL